MSSDQILHRLKNSLEQWYLLRFPTSKNQSVEFTNHSNQPFSTNYELDIVPKGIGIIANDSRSPQYLNSKSKELFEKFGLTTEAVITSSQQIGNRSFRQRILPIIYPQLDLESKIEAIEHATLDMAQRMDLENFDPSLPTEDQPYLSRLKFLRTFDNDVGLRPNGSPKHPNQVIDVFTKETLKLANQIEQLDDSSQMSEREAMEERMDRIRDLTKEWGIEDRFNSQLEIQSSRPRNSEIGWIR